MSLSVIVALAGQGKRMKTSVPKQFLEFEGVPLFIYTLEEIERCDVVSEMILVTSNEYISYLQEEIEKYKIQKVSKIVEGGKERQDSILNGIKHVSDMCHYISVQDGVRPLVKGDYFTQSIEVLERDSMIQGVVVGVWAKDTIKIVNSQGVIESTPLRSTLFHAQTPQTFRKEILLKAYGHAKDTDFVGTDDASLVENLGEKVMIVEGEYENIKVTTPSDLDVFKKFKEVRDESKN